MIPFEPPPAPVTAAVPAVEEVPHDSREFLDEDEVETLPPASVPVPFHRIWRLFLASGGLDRPGGRLLLAAAGLYVSSFFLPLDLSFCPCGGIVVFLFAPVYSFVGSSAWSWLLAVVWLANPVVWVGFWQWRRRPRLALWAGIVATLLATAPFPVLLTAEEGDWAIVPCHAAWVASMILLALAGRRAASANRESDPDDEP